MAGIATVLVSEPHWDDEISDLESRFSELHMKYGDLCAKHRPHGNSVQFSRDAAKYLYAPEYPELLRSSGDIREDRNAFIQQLAQPPEWPPPQRLLAERIRLEVQSAAVARHDFEGSRNRLHSLFLRKRDALRNQKAMVMDRLKRYARDWSAVRQIGGRLHGRLRLLQQDLECVESRLRRLAPSVCMSSAAKDRPVAKASTGEDLFFKSTPYEEGTLSCIFRGDVVAGLRETIFEDRATRMLRRFLQRMQHIPLSHRRDIWRKTLQLKAAAEQFDRSPLPLVAISTEKLANALAVLGEAVGIRENLLSDEGHTFVYSVGLEFPRIIERQTEEIVFAQYPDVATEAFMNWTRASLEQPSSWFGQAEVTPLRQETPNSERDSIPSSLGVNGPSKRQNIFWGNSEWVHFVLLRPRVDRYVIEQRSLLRPRRAQDQRGGVSGCSHDAQLNSGGRRASVTGKAASALSSRASPSIGHSRGAHRMRDKRAHGRKHADGTAHNAFEEHETDLGLQGELTFVREGRAKTSHKTLCGRAAKAAAITGLKGFSGEPASDGADKAGPASFSMPPEHMLQSYYLLRYIHSRELRCSLLHLLNLYRYAQRKLAHGVLAAQIGHLDEGGSLSSSASPGASFHKGGSMNKHRRKALGGSNKSNAAVLQSAVERGLHSAPSLPAADPACASSLPEDSRLALQILSSPERLVIKNGKTVVVDDNGLEIVHEIVRDDLELIENEIVEIGSHYIKRAEAATNKDGGEATQDGGSRGDTVDRAGVLYDLLHAELRFHKAKWQLLEPYLEIFEHTVDPAGRHALAQRITDVMAFRPHFDLNASYFVEAYAAATAAVEERARLLRTTLDHQVRLEQYIMSEIDARSERLREEGFSKTNRADNETSGQDSTDPQLHLPIGMSHPGEGLPSYGRVGLSICLSPTAKDESRAVDLFEFFFSANLAWHVDLLVEDIHRHFCETFETDVRFHAIIQRACAMVIASEWHQEVAKHPVHLRSASNSSGDIFGCEGMDDPAGLTLLIEDTMKSLPTIFGDGKPCHEDADLRHAFSELSARPPDERVLVMYLNLLEHVTVRRLLTDTVLELRALEVILADQGRAVGVEAVFRNDPLSEFGEYPTQIAHAARKSVASSFDAAPGKRMLLVGDIDAEFAKLDFSRHSNVVLYCCDSNLRQLRATYQHELANRWLYVMCALYNIIITDSHMKRQVLQELKVKPSPDISKNDLGMRILADFRSTCALSPKMWELPVRDINDPSAQGMPVLSDFTRLASLCQFPSVPKSPVRIGISAVFRERTRDLKQCLQNAGGGSREKVLKRFKARLLSHGSLFIAEAACDLAVRVQAAHAALEAHHLVSLLPSEFSPFSFSTPVNPLVFVDSSCAVGSIFNVPRASELLQMRGTSKTAPDVTRRILEADSLLPSVFEDTPASVSALPTLDLRYSGPAFVALELLQVLMPLVSQIFFWSSLAADRRIMLHLHHAVSSADYETGAHRAAKSVLNEDMLQTVTADDLEQETGPIDPAQKTWDAWENMRVDFMNLQGQLQSLKDHSTESIHGLLRERTRCAAWRTSVLLRQGVSDALGHDDPETATEMRRWALYLDGYPVDGGNQLFMAESASRFAVKVDAPQTVDADFHLKRLALVRTTDLQCASNFRNVMIPGHSPEGSAYAGYPKPLQNPCSYFHPFLQAVLATHAIDDDYVSTASVPQSGKAHHEVLPFNGRTPWQFPTLPMESMTRGLCLLPGTVRQAVAEVHLQLEMKLESYCELREVAPDDAASLEAESELMRTLLTLSRLREAVLCAQLFVAPPATPSELQLLDDHFAGMVAKDSSTADACENDPGAMVDRDDAAGPTNPGGDEAFKKDTEDILQDLSRLAIKMEMRSAYDVVTRLMGEAHKVLLSFSVAVIEKMYESLRGHCHHHHHEHAAPGTSGGFASLAVTENARVQAVAAFNRIRLRGTQVRTHGQPITQNAFAAYVIREQDVDECIEELGQRALQWATQALDGQYTRSKEQVVASTASLRKLEQYANQQRWNRRANESLFDAQVTAAAADRGSSQLFEADRLHRVLNELAAAGFEMEYRLNAEIRHTVLGEIGQLEKQLVDAQVRRDKYLADMRGTVQQEVQQLKQHIFHQLTSMSKANFILRQKLESFQEETRMAETSSITPSTPRASTFHANDGHAVPLPLAAQKNLQPLKGPVVTESGLQLPQADIESLHEEINALRRGNTRLQTFYRMKFQNMRQNFEQKIQAFTTTLSSNSDLWERASEIKEREIIAEEELGKSQRRVAAASTTIERISIDVAKEAETASRLQAWKAHAFEWLDRLQREERKYQHEGGHIDLKKVGHQITKLDAEIKQLDQGYLIEDRIQLEKQNASYETKHLRQQLKIEETLAVKAKRKADLIQREMECGELVDDESLVGLMCDEYRSIASQLAEVEAKNEALKAKLESHEQAAKLSTKLPSPDKLDLQGRDFDEHMCYSVGFMKCPRAPWYRNQIDSSLEARTGSSLSQNSNPKATTPRSQLQQQPRQSQEQPQHWSSESVAQRRGVLAGVREEIAKLEPSYQKTKPGKRVMPFDVERRRDIGILPPASPRDAPTKPLIKSRHTIQGLFDVTVPNESAPRRISFARSRRSVNFG